MKKFPTGVQNWDATKSEYNDYNLNERVYYKDEVTKTEGVYYRTGDTTALSPDHSGQGWTLDTDYITPWTHMGKYVRNESVVSQLVGDNTYYYKASPRYFGGNEYPHLEEDLDGIRTWELYTEYYSTEDVVRLIPFRKNFGVMFRGDDDWQKKPDIANTEDFLNEGTFFVPWKPERYWDSVRIYQQNTSVYEADPYNENVYKFVDDKVNLDGSEIHLKRGIHKAQWFKQKANSYDRAEAAWASRQKKYTGGGYLQPHGMSIEVWPATTDTEFELIPFHGSIDSSPVPTLTISVPSEKMIMGVDNVPAGVTPIWTESTPDDCYMTVSASFNHITFQDRTLTLVFELVHYSHWWVKDAGGYYNLKFPDEPELQVVEKTINTNEASYSNATNWVLPVIDWYNFKRANTRTYICYTGYRIH